MGANRIIVRRIISDRQDGTDARLYTFVAFKSYGIWDIDNNYPVQIKTLGKDTRTASHSERRALSASFGTAGLCYGYKD